MSWQGCGSQIDLPDVAFWLEMRRVRAPEEELSFSSSARAITEVRRFGKIQTASDNSVSLVQTGHVRMQWKNI